MAEGQFFTIVIWEIRAGYQGAELEELTRTGIIPHYSQIPGIVSIKLFKIVESEDVNKYMALTIYESREAYNNWWNKSDIELLEWQKKNKVVLDRWVDVATPIRKHNMILMVDAEFPPGPPKA